MRRLFLVVLGLALVLGAGVPALASAHEVYVLSPGTVAHDTFARSPNPFDAFDQNTYRFFFWGFIALLTVSTIFCMSLFRVLERLFAPRLMRLRRYAPLIARVTLGVCLIACAYYQGLFGPELPLAAFAGPLAPLVAALLYLCGALIVVGYLTRTAALICLVLFAFAAARFGSYLFTYANYFGEMLVALTVGGGLLSVDGARTPAAAAWRWLVRVLEPYAYFFMRAGLGISVMYAAFYAKFIHSSLALDTVAQYHLTNYFHFDPLFIVLGAFIIESLIGLFFILGIEVRWTALFFLFWLSLSLWYFGEAVWPHLILIGLNVAIFAAGYDRYTLEGRLFFARGRRDPVL